MFFVHKLIKFRPLLRRWFKVRLFYSVISLFLDANVQQFKTLINFLATGSE